MTLPLKARSARPKAAPPSSSIPLPLMSQPDPNAEYWATSEVAQYLGVQLGTVATYRRRGQMPAPDITVGGRPAWRPATIREWHANRPGRGWRTGRGAS